MTNSLEQFMQTFVPKVETELRKAIPGGWEMPENLRASMEYSLLGGGKRLRPILLLAAAEAVNGSPDMALPAACAVEMIHTYSLIHDDLPAMDNDDFRRGKPSNHKVYGEAMAILAGDALLTHAFYLFTQLAHTGVPHAQIVKIIEECSVYAGAKGMVGGQAADLEGVQGVTDLVQLEYIHTHKTSDMIVFALKTGGRIGGADDRQLNALEQFGYRIGLAFQIQDDILDLTGDEKKLGKKTKSDEKQEKVTYPYIVGLEKSAEKVRELTESGKEWIRRGLFPYPDRLLALADYLMQRDH